MSGDSRGIVLVGKYELHEQLAAGGMATVFLGRASQNPGQGYYAIKRLHEHLARDEELVTLLLEEARITERIRHPNIVATLDVEKLDHELLLVMEYVHGETLSELLKTCSRTKQRCPVPIAATIFHGILLGLDAAHNATDAHGQPLCIVHRDVSPQNIIVGADGVPRLLDFGIAKAIGSITHTRTGELRGKVPYMAPEILKFDPATRQSDVWAAAVVLWETLCARRLFKGESMTVWGQILTADLVAPGTVLGTPTPLDGVVMRGLSRDRSTRFATAAEMAAAIAAAVPLVPANEVAAWVTSLASEALTHRVQVLQAIGARPPTLRGSHAARVVNDELGSLGVATSTLGRAPGPVSTRGSRRARVWMPWTISFVLAALVLVLVARRGPKDTRNQAATSASVSSAVAATPPPPPPPADSTSALVSSADPVSSSAIPLITPPPLPPTSSSTTALKPKFVGSPRHPQSRPPASTTTAAATSAPPAPTKPTSTNPNCDPPFSIDEGGRKVYKLECVKGN